ncbi:melatonin receptor [Desmophyllum pertusum]|uniref:Melatonin receptor n=1 Tax=Desmophyllum pertusum TaxID=174260 RepID=A0A9W9Z3E5_9CNID|nr:melatonin receptor [Desmophyllum pertusum]
MDSGEEQLAKMSEELKSRSIVKVALDSGFFTLILLILFVGNFITLLVIALNKRNANNSEHVRRVPRYLGLLVRSTLSMSYCAYSIGSISLAFQRYNLTIPRIHSWTLAVASTQTLALMALKQVFSDC